MGQKMYLEIETLKIHISPPSVAEMVASASTILHVNWDKEFNVVLSEIEKMTSFVRLGFACKSIR